MATKRAKPVPKPPDNRREAILEAAIEEFRDKGLAGARVDEIARRSRSNKQLIYYYFKNKQGLYNESLGRMIGRSHERLDSRPEVSTYADEVAEINQRAFAESREWFRFWMWEALDKGDRNITREKDRVQVFRRTTDDVRRAQASGELDPRFDSELLALAITAITTFPHVLPQLTKLVVGVSHDDAEFRQRQTDFVAILMAHLAPPPAAPPRRAARAKPAAARGARAKRG
jgi:TetR/AcrR family transcriptional regulator